MLFSNCRLAIGRLTGLLHGHAAQNVCLHGKNKSPPGLNSTTGWRTAMAFHEFMISLVRVRSTLLVVVALGFCGCAVVGPQSRERGQTGSGLTK